MNIDRSSTLLLRLQVDMQQTLGARRRPLRTQLGTSADAETRIWVAGRAGVKTMTLQQFERWR